MLEKHRKKPEDKTLLQSIPDFLLYVEIHHILTHKLLLPAS